MQSPGLPLVSIVTPSYNSADFIEAAIASVLAQDYPSLEHIIIDGGSTDGTLEIVAKYEHKLTWISEPDEGQADALNKGFQRARGEIIGWLNADDMYQPQAVSSAVKYLREHPGIRAVYGNFNFIDASGQIIHTQHVEPFAPEKLLYANIIPNVGLFFRRDILTELKGVNPRLHYVMDWDFVLRLALHYRVGQVAAVWGNFRITPGTKSVEQADRFWPEIIPVLQEVTSLPESRLNAHQANALFWANFFAAIEFVRTQRLEAAKNYLAQALSYKMPPLGEAADLAVAVIQTVIWPWHQAFREQPQAQTTLLNFVSCLGGSPTEKALSAYLELYRGLLECKQRQWGQAKALLAKNWSVLPKRDLLRPAVLKLLLYLLLGKSRISSISTLKHHLIPKN